jgi:tetratricopeptide (TPR) repeat protein
MTASKVTRISSILASALALSLMIMIAAPLSGCSGSPKPAADGGTSDYMSLFKSGQYARAYEVASAQAQRTRGYEADRASLYAGMSAHALDRNADARRWLTPVVDSGDREISGNAAATLGLIAQEGGDHAAAVDLLSKAGSKLSGDESALSLMYAGDSMMRLGQRDKAHQTWETARERIVADVALRVMIGDRLAGHGPTTANGRPSTGSTPGSAQPSIGGYTVQAGAFGNRRTADSTAAKLNAIAPARVVTITSSKGQPLHAVRLGRFRTRAEADQVRVRVGKDARVVAAE